MDKILANIHVMESYSGTYEGTAYNKVTARYPSKDGRVMVFKSKIDMKEHVDEDVTVVLDITVGQNLAATVKIVAVQE